MYCENNIPIRTSDLVAERCITKAQADELAANAVRLAFQRFHLSMDASSDLVISDLVST